MPFSEFAKRLPRALLASQKRRWFEKKELISDKTYNERGKKQWLWAFRMVAASQYIAQHMWGGEFCVQGKLRTKTGSAELQSLSTTPNANAPQGEATSEMRTTQPSIGLPGLG